MFLPKNTTSRLYLLIQILSEILYRKLLLCLVVSRINDSQTATQIIEVVQILQTISWLQTAWKSVTPEIIKNCVWKCDFDVENNCETLNDRIDVEFREFVWSIFFRNWHRRIHRYWHWSCYILTSNFFAQKIQNSIQRIPGYSGHFF